MQQARALLVAPFECFGELQQIERLHNYPGVELSGVVQI
jgi:hypothetical protein